MRGFGAELIEQGDDYDAAAQVAERLVRERGLTLVHSTNHRQVIAGAATITLEMLEQEPGLDALVLAVGGGPPGGGARTAPRAGGPPPVGVGGPGGGGGGGPRSLAQGQTGT